MSSNYGNKKKAEQLGMPYGTANGRLRKQILFHLLERHGENVCFQCGEKIECADVLSIEHKKPWLDESVDLFWDLDNIAFSHLKCNISVRRSGYSCPGNQGTNQHNSKLTDEDVRDIRKDPRNHYVIAEEYGITQPNIGKIKSKNFGVG